MLYTIAQALVDAKPNHFRFYPLNVMLSPSSSRSPSPSPHTSLLGPSTSRPRSSSRTTPASFKQSSLDTYVNQKGTDSAASGTERHHPQMKLEDGSGRHMINLIESEDDEVQILDTPSVPSLTSSTSFSAPPHQPTPTSVPFKNSSTPASSDRLHTPSPSPHTCSSPSSLPTAASLLDASPPLSSPPAPSPQEPPQEQHSTSPPLHQHETHSSPAPPPPPPHKPFTPSHIKTSSATHHESPPPRHSTAAPHISTSKSADSSSPSADASISSMPHHEFIKRHKAPIAENPPSITVVVAADKTKPMEHIKMSSVLAPPSISERTNAQISTLSTSNTATNVTPSCRKLKVCFVLLHPVFVIVPQTQLPQTLLKRPSSEISPS